MGEKGKTIGGRTLLEWKWFIPHRDNPKEMRRIDDLLDAAFAEPETCEWAYDEAHDKWDTECGCAHEFNMGAPGDNHYEFCPFPGCGKKIVEIGEPEPKYDGQTNCQKCGTRHPIGQPCQCDAEQPDNENTQQECPHWCDMLCELGYSCPNAEPEETDLLGQALGRIERLEEQVKGIKNIQEQTDQIGFNLAQLSGQVGRNSETVGRLENTDDAEPDPKISSLEKQLDENSKRIEAIFDLHSHLKEIIYDIQEGE